MRELGICYCGHSIHDHYGCGIPENTWCGRRGCECNQFGDRVHVRMEHWQRSSPKAIAKEWGE